MLTGDYMKCQRVLVSDFTPKEPVPTFWRMEAHFTPIYGPDSVCIVIADLLASLWSRDSALRSHYLLSLSLHGFPRL
jgi:hypothetical protein